MILSTILSSIASGAIVVRLILHLSQLGDIFANQIEQLENNRPIIGVLAQEISYHLNKKFPNQYESFIAASYVKLIEGAGGLVVPIWIGKNESYYEDVMGKVNGVLWPGGSTYFNQTNGYADAGKMIYEIAIRMNEKGDYFPILGICLGFELLTYVAAGGIEHRSGCSSNKQSLPLVFKDDYRSSRMFADAPDTVIEILASYNVTGNYHQYCVTEQDLEKVGLNRVFRVISVNNDWNGLEFISSTEHFEMPFYGLQFHPEKNLYEWIATKNIPRGAASVIASQYFANFFVNEARKNTHSFSPIDEVNSLVFNYPLTYTTLVGSSYTQCYLFTNRSGDDA